MTCSFPSWDFETPVCTCTVVCVMRLPVGVLVSPIVGVLLPGPHSPPGTYFHCYWRRAILLGMRRNIVSKFLSTSRPRLRCGGGFRTRSMLWHGRKWPAFSFLPLSRPTQLISSSPHSLTCDSIRRERQHLCVKPRSRRFPIAAGK